MNSVSKSHKRPSSETPLKRPVRIGMMSLGCPKTLVDSEVILGKLADGQYEITGSVENCDVALLNTCAFIQDAQKESIDRILELIELKKGKQIQALIVMGCLVQKFPNDLQDELKEVDAFIGSGDYSKIPEIVRNVIGGEKVYSVGEPGYLSTSSETRVALTPQHYRYVKISEGCDHICSFCSIPNFRGKHRSRTIEDVVEESKRLLASGCRELILTGQDTTYFGRDLENQFLLPNLLRRLDQLEGDFWIRLLYAYPSCVTTELMETIRDAKHICRYLDMPLQHASDRMLLAMRRGITKRRTIDLIQKFRATVPGLAIRTTFIVGFPGETEEDFEELLAFMEEMKFERAGIFTYSPEADTPGAVMQNQVPEKVKKSRRDRAMLLQQKISMELNQRAVGREFRVLVDHKSPKKGEVWVTRTYQDGPEIDGTVLVKSKTSLLPGTFCNVRITAAKEYDLLGEI